MVKKTLDLKENDTEINSIIENKNINVVDEKDENLQSFLDAFLYRK